MENINIADILRHAPKGTKLYTPIFGECTFQDVNCENKIVCYRSPDDGRVIEFNAYGRIWCGEEGECLLFPSKDNKDWNTFPGQNDAIVHYEEGALLCSDYNDDIIVICVDDFDKGEYLYRPLLDCYNDKGIVVYRLTHSDAAEHWHEYKPRYISLSNLSPGHIIFRRIRNEKGFKVCSMTTDDFTPSAEGLYYGIPMDSRILNELGFKSTDYHVMTYAIDKTTRLEYHTESRKMEKIWITTNKFDTNVMVTLFAAHINYLHELQIAMKFCGVHFDYSVFEKSIKV